MPALNFKAQFAEQVASGTKFQSIRAPRRDGRPHAVTGQTIKLYTGMRTKGCRLLKTGTVISVESVSIHHDGVSLGDGTLRRFWMGANSSPLRRGLLEGFAKADGFDGWAAMRDWFDKTHGLPFVGTLIKWAPQP